MSGKGLYFAAIFALLLSLFPFVCAVEGIGFGEYVLWHYPVLFAVLAAFCALGRLAGAWAAGGSFTSKQKCWALFASRAAVALPVTAFIIVQAVLSLSTALYLYLLPACIIAYFGGHHTVGMVYSDVFSRAWFALYFVTALLCSGLLWFTHDEELISSGGFQLCFVFGILIVLAAVLTNQTNIDSRTAQRSSGRSVLPKGLRGYNAALIAAVCAVTVGLFLFAKPLAGLLGNGFKAILALLLALIRSGKQTAEDDKEFAQDTEGMELTAAENAVFGLLNVLLAAGIVLLAIRFRRQILEFLKELFAPMFKESARPDDLPFVDEMSDSLAKGGAERTRRKSEQQLLKRYKKETDPIAKYRIGYTLFMLRLARSPFPQTPSDTTTIHRQKGTNAFRREDIGGMISVYNAVRYGGRVPTEEEISAQAQMLNELR